MHNRQLMRVLSRSACENFFLRKYTRGEQRIIYTWLQDLLLAQSCSAMAFSDDM